MPDVDAVCNEDTVDNAELRSAAKVRPKEIAAILRDYTVRQAKISMISPDLYIILLDLY